MFVIPHHDISWVHSISAIAESVYRLPRSEPSSPSEDPLNPVPPLLQRQVRERSLRRRHLRVGFQLSVHLFLGSHLLSRSELHIYLFFQYTTNEKTREVRGYLNTEFFPSLKWEQAVKLREMAWISKKPQSNKAIPTGAKSKC